MSIRVLARSALLAGVALASAAAASADVFMKVEGTPGEARQRGFEGQVVLSGATINISSFVTPDPEGIADAVRTVNAGSLYLTKAPDRSSPKLMMSAVEGAPLGTIEISFTSPNPNGVGQTVDAKWIIEGAEVRGYNAYPDAAMGNMPVEQIEIAYASMRYQYFTKDAKGQRTGGMEEVKWKVPEGQLFPSDGDCR
jgi:type VI protein secretion system component Hcp